MVDESSSHKLWNANYLRTWTANFMLNFAFMVLTPLLPLYLSETYGASKDQIGLVLSGYALTALLVRPFSGFLVDSFPRKAVLLACYFLFFILFGGYLVAGSLLAFCIVRTLHGAPMGATTVSNSTVAIDVLPSQRRAEGIGYYGLSNNLATAISPTIGLLIYHWTGRYEVIFVLAMLMAGVGLLVNATLRLKPRPLQKDKQRLSLDRFILLKGWSEGLSMVTYGFSYGVISTYLAIYGKEELGVTAGTGLFFALLSTGLILSRLVGARSLREGHVSANARGGALVSVVGYLLFAAVHEPWAYYASALIIGLGNGHMFPAFQTMFINLAPNSQRGTANGTLLTAWDLGVGLGIIMGGAVAEFASYHAAFWMAWLANAAGTAFFLAYGRRHFETNKLR
ncbi:MAG: MFS transporter [Bacteroidaceae bacterium]|nr:MFS transporter [Bacteroidaceae bacterium]MBQ3991574.1 MFS transporter [Bacteroidaceae bacterium]